MTPERAGELAEQAGMVNLFFHGAASMVFTHGVGGVTQEQLMKFANLCCAEELAALQTENKWWAGIVNDCGQATFDEVKRLTKELAEAKRDTGLAKLVIQQKQDQIASAEAALEQADARALANEKDADKQWYLGVRNALNRLVDTPHEDWPDAIEKIRADNDARYAAIGAKHASDT